MRKLPFYLSSYYKIAMLLILSVTIAGNSLLAQDSTAAPVKEVKKKVYTKSTFEGNYLIDNQSVMVPIKGTFEFDIQHRFGTMDHQFTDLFGLFASATMRLGFSYVVIKDLQVGFGASNDRMQVDGNLKYAVLRQTKDNNMPISVTLYGNTVMDTRARNSSVPIVVFSDRLSYFSQLIVAKKFSEKFSVQVAPSLSYFNNVQGYYDASGIVKAQMNNAHLAFSAGGRYKISKSMSLIVNYDQPLTQHPMNNPHPNISFGLDMKSSGHDFQVFAGNYGYILPQNNNLFNQNDYTRGQFLIGFNISRLWNF